MKKDAGPRRLSKEASSTDFREEMHNLRYVILLGLPNGTSAIQEMDQGYGPFKRETDKSTIRFASRKMVERVVARQKEKSRSNEVGMPDRVRRGELPEDIGVLTVQEFDQFVEVEPEDGDDEDAFTLVHGKSV